MVWGSRATDLWAEEGVFWVLEVTSDRSSTGVNGYTVGAGLSESFSDSGAVMGVLPVLPTICSLDSWEVPTSKGGGILMGGKTDCRGERRLLVAGSAASFERETGVLTALGLGSTTALFVNAGKATSVAASPRVAVVRSSCEDSSTAGVAPEMLVIEMLGRWRTVSSRDPIATT